MRVKGQYYYKAYAYAGNGFAYAVRVECFDTLSDARKYCKSHGITQGEILRYHVFRGLEDKSYHI